MWPPLLQRSNDKLLELCFHVHERRELALGRHCAHVLGVRPSRFNTMIVRNNTRDDSILRKIPWDVRSLTLGMVYHGTVFNIVV